LISTNPISLLTADLNAWNFTALEQWRAGSTYTYTVKADDINPTGLTDSNYTFSITITCRVTDFSISSPTIPNILMIIAGLPQLIALPTITMTPLGCLNYTSTLTPVPYWVTNSATTITTTTADDPGLQGTYSFTYNIGPISPDVSHLLDAPFPTSYSLPFTVTLVSCTTGSISPDAPGPYNYTYFIDGTQQFFSLPTYTVLPLTCPYTYSISILMADNITPTPTWINNTYTSLTPSFAI
jgi:hypothetical protein